MAILTIGHSDDYWRPAKIDSPLIAHFSSFELQDRKPTRSSSDQLILPSSLVHQTLEIRTWNLELKVITLFSCRLLITNATLAMRSVVRHSSMMYFLVSNPHTSGDQHLWKLFL